MIARLKHVKRARVKGKTYYYHRITRERLPDDYDERVARVVEVNRTLKGDARKVAPGSLADTVALYKASPAYRTLAAKTRHNYAIYLDLLCETWGHFPVSSIRRPHILALRDKLADKPSKANMTVTVLRILLSFAVEREICADNPARGVRKLAGGPGHSAWPEDAVERFLAVAPPMMALALKLGLYTGQREGDCLAMTWHDYNGDEIYVAQSKTGTKLWIPVHSDLKGALDAQERVSPTILTTAKGKPFRDSSFRHRFGKVVKDAGLVGLSFHGLRYTAAARLAEAGCSLKEIASITGHRSLAMLEKYSRSADQRRLAGAAILRLENAQRTKNGKLR